jgi:2-oxoglutarate ferredoxin oxidoreductase subunit beta
MALFELKRDPSQTAVFSGIGCSAKTPHYLNVYGVHTLHGRVLPLAQGAKLANPHLTVVAVGGDGDGLGIGAGHFVAAGRRNVDMLYILYDNEVYGLTKGQAGPTLGLWEKTKSLPKPNPQSRLNPLLLAFAAGYTWIGRGYAYDVKGLKELIKEGITHKGLAFLHVLQPCPTYNDLHTKEWFAPRLYKLQEEGYDPHVPEGLPPEELDRKMALFQEKALEWGERIPVGVFWKAEVPTFGERLKAYLPRYPEVYPAQGQTEALDLEGLLKEFAL